MYHYIQIIQLHNIWNKCTETKMHNTLPYSCGSYCSHKHFTAFTFSYYPLSSSQTVCLAWRTTSACMDLTSKHMSGFPATQCVRARLTFRMLPLWLPSVGNVKGISSSEAPSDRDISYSLWMSYIFHSVMSLTHCHTLHCTSNTKLNMARQRNTHFSLR